MQVCPNMSTHAIEQNWTVFKPWFWY